MVAIFLRLSNLIFIIQSVYTYQLDKLQVTVTVTMTVTMTVTVTVTVTDMGSTTCGFKRTARSKRWALRIANIVRTLNAPRDFRSLDHIENIQKVTRILLVIAFGLLAEG